MTTPLRARIWGALRQHPWWTLETVFALGLAASLIGLWPLRLYLRGTVIATVQGIGAFFSLLAVDFAATLLLGALTLVKVALIAAPGGRLLKRVRRPHRFAWLPLFGIGVLLALPIVFAAICTWGTWLSFLGAAGLGWWLAASHRWYLRPAALLPLALGLHPAVEHSPLADLLFSPSRLADRCRTNDGVRPLGFTAALAKPRYYSVTRLDDDTLLLVGERKVSWWLKRDPRSRRFRLERRSRVSANLWEGCVWGRTIWLTHGGRLFRVTRLPDGAAAPEKVQTYRFPKEGEFDFLDAICDVPGGRVFATELMHGRLHELDVKTGAMRSRYLGSRIYVQMVRRSDGHLVGIDTAHLFVYDPERDRTVESTAAGLAAVGLDVCQHDGAAVVADMAGRVRLFERGAAGRYRFTRGALARSPRRVEFSTDCRLIGVTSADDRTVVVLRRRDLAEVARYRVGPSLRDLTFISARELVIVDACSATFVTVKE